MPLPYLQPLLQDYPEFAECKDKEQVLEKMNLMLKAKGVDFFNTMVVSSMDMNVKVFAEFMASFKSKTPLLPPDDYDESLEEENEELPDDAETPPDESDDTEFQGVDALTDVVVRPIQQPQIRWEDDGVPMTVRVHSGKEKYPQIDPATKQGQALLEPLLGLFRNDSRFHIKYIKNGVVISLNGNSKRVLLRYRGLQRRPEGIRGILYANKIYSVQEFRDLLPPIYGSIKVYKYNEGSSVMVNSFYMDDLIEIGGPDSPLMQRSLELAQQTERVTKTRADQHLQSLEGKKKKSIKKK